MNIILAALNSKFVHSNLAIRYIKAYSKENYFKNTRHNIEIFEATINENIMDIAHRIMDKRPQVVTFSCYIWNIENTLKLCSILKEIDSSLIIILGGPEVSFDSKNILYTNSFIDYVIKGEGEISFTELIQAVTTNSFVDDIKGICFRKGNNIIENEDRELIANLDIIPFPYNEELPDKIIYFEAARGCPFNCSYCLSCTIKGVRRFSLDRVKKDLKYFIDNDVKLIKFVDRTFNSNKKFALEIWNFLIENKKNTKFHFEIAADILDAEMIQLLSKAPKGLFQFEAGIQTTNPDILENINRRMDFNKVKENLTKIKENDNIHCHIDLIAGLPGEDLASFKKSFNMCMDIDPDVLQLGFLKVLKGSLICEDIQRYDLHFIKYPPYQILYTSTLSYEEIRQLIDLENVFETYYNSEIFGFTIKYILKKYQDKFEFFKNLTSFLKDKGYFGKSIDLRNKFRLLLNYLETQKGVFNLEIIKDIMIHDFIINTKKIVLPDFLKKDLDKNLKEAIYLNKDIITEKLGSFNIKNIFYIPVNTKIIKNNGIVTYENSKSLLVLDLISLNYCYIDFNSSNE